MALGSLIPTTLITTGRTLVQRVCSQGDDAATGYRLARGAFWSLVGTSVSRVFTIASAIIVARVMGKENYGGYGIVQSTIGMFGMFADLALGATATKYLAEYRRTDPRRAGRVLGFATTLSLLTGGASATALYILAPWLATVSLNSPSLAPVIRIGALLLFVSTLNSVLFGALAGFESFRIIARVNVLQAIATPLIAVPLVYCFSVQGAVVALILVATIGLLLCRRALLAECRRYHIESRLFDSVSRDEVNILLRFSAPAMLSGLLVMPVTWFCNTVLVRQANGLGELGLFNAANQWRQFVLVLPQILGSVMLPIFSEVHGRTDKNDFLRTLTLNLRLTWTVALPATALVIALRVPLSSLFGEKFVGVAPLIVVLVLTCFLYAVNNVVGTALVGSGRMWVGSFFNMAWAVVLIAATMILVPRLGGLGLAFAYLIAYLLHSVWQMFYVDIRLARSAVRSQWDLILLSFVTLVPVALASHPRLQHYPVGIVTTIVAFIPLCRLMKAWLVKAAE